MNAERVSSTKMIMDIKAPAGNLKTDVVSRKFSEKLTSFSESKGRELSPKKDIRNVLRNDLKRDSGLNKANEVKTEQNPNPEKKVENVNNKENKQVVDKSKEKETESTQETKKTVDSQEKTNTEELASDIIDENLQVVVAMANLTEEKEIKPALDLQAGKELETELKIVTDDLAVKPELETELASNQPALELENSTIIKEEPILVESQPVEVNQTIGTEVKEVIVKVTEGNVDNPEKVLPKVQVQETEETKLENKTAAQVLDETKVVVNSQNSGENTGAKRESYTSSSNKEDTSIIKEDLKGLANLNVHERGDFRTFEEVVVEKFDTEKQTVDKMLKDISYELDSSKKQMKIKLQPRELGDMTLDMRMVKGELVAKIVVDNEKARVMIEQNLINLKETLRKQNIEIKTVEVQVGTNEDYEMHGQNMNQEQANRRQKQTFKARNNNFGYTIESFEEISAETGEIISEGFDVSV
ncbi:MAG: flagellar hook-length control protein FliK [Tissierellia bacterium]|nr:flagellar hook-length control protein FliK [Tissierellia bacterium]